MRVTAVAEVPRRSRLLLLAVPTGRLPERVVLAKSFRVGDAAPAADAPVGREVAPRWVDARAPAPLPTRLPTEDGRTEDGPTDDGPTDERRWLVER